MSYDIQKLKAGGATVREIAQLTGLSIAAVHNKLVPEPRAAVTPAPTLKPRRRKGTERPCMTCRQPFMSEGPHNRLCDCCRKQRLSAFDYSPS